MEQEVLTMPVIVHEEAEMRSDRKNRRLWLTILALIGVIALIVVGIGNGSDRGET